MLCYAMPSVPVVCHLSTLLQGVLTSPSTSLPRRRGRPKAGTRRTRHRYGPNGKASTMPIAAWGDARSATHPSLSPPPCNPILTSPNTRCSSTRSSELRASVMNVAALRPSSMSLFAIAPRKGLYSLPPLLCEPITNAVSDYIESKGAVGITLTLPLAAELRAYVADFGYLPRQELLRDWTSLSAFLFPHAESLYASTHRYGLCIWLCFPHQQPSILGIMNRTKLDALLRGDRRVCAPSAPFNIGRVPLSGDQL